MDGGDLDQVGDQNWYIYYSFLNHTAGMYMGRLVFYNNKGMYYIRWLSSV